MSDWYPFDSGKSVGLKGSENGIILYDEEHPDGSRITLERGGRQPFTITCGIYGWMVHTCFFTTEKEAHIAFHAMKSELARILNLVPPASNMEQRKVDAVSEELYDFVERFP
jgi:hypothetical protein